MNDERTINIYDEQGIFVLMAEGRNQGPIILETEGQFSSQEEAMRRAQEGKRWLRVCVCRVIPVCGNELLALDMQRMQPQEKEMPF